MNLWAAEWHSNCQLDGESKYIIHHDLLPALFRTRRECRGFITDKYGYIAERLDLRNEPHGWLMPKAIKVEIIKQKEAHSDNK